MRAAALYGKLPAYGDFIQRNLPAGSAAEWDRWLQHYVAGTRELLGPAWLDTYLTSPIWRFVLSHGVLDEHAWAGVLMPSVDKVGRYFPFTVIVALEPHAAPAQFAAARAAWFGAIEDLALGALDGELDVDGLLRALVEHSPAAPPANGPGARAAGLDVQADLDATADDATQAYPRLMDALMDKTLRSYSLWSTTGSARVAPCVFVAQGLPAPRRLPAMLDGQWQAWGWQAGQARAAAPAEGLGT